MRKWWEIPPESVYAFTFYIFQQLNRWPTNGEDDYPRNIRALSSSEGVPIVRIRELASDVHDLKLLSQLAEMLMAGGI